MISLQRTSTGKHIIRIDASMLAESNCYRKVWFKLFRGLVADGGEKDFKMEYGTAFHKMLKEYYGGMSMELASQIAFTHYSQPEIFIPENDWRTVGHLMLCCRQYGEYYKANGDLLTPLIVDGRPMLEMGFAVPFLSTDTVDVLLCGTIDFRGSYSNAVPVIVDHKTTSLSQVDNYLNSYCLSPQLMTYKIIYELLFPDQPVQCMINGIFLNRTNKNVFRRSSLIDFTPQQIAHHKRFIKRTILHIVDGFTKWQDRVSHGMDGDDVLDQSFSPNYTCCHESYGMCDCLPLCLADTKDNMEGIVVTSYKQRVYDPTKFQT